MASVFVEVVEKKCTAIIVRKLNEVLPILGFVNGDVMERWNRVDACGLGLVRENSWTLVRQLIGLSLTQLRMITGLQLSC